MRAYVDRLYRGLAAFDLAVVEGGLTTSMELTANRRPSSTSRSATTSSRTSTSGHRLDRYRSGRCLDVQRETPETIAAAIAETIG